VVCLGLFLCLRLTKKVEGAIAALQEWLTDAKRSPEKWIVGVKSIIEKAKHLSS
jgi:hypothetical protein